MWVARTFTTLVVLAILLITALTVRRDRMYRRHLMDLLEVCVNRLNEQLAVNPYLPVAWPLDNLPDRIRSDFAQRFEYAQDAIRDFARVRNAPTIIAWSHVLPIVLGADGRAVAVYENGRVRAAWMTEAEFDRHMAEQEEALRRAIRDIGS